MPASRAAKRRQLSRLRAGLFDQPLAIDARFLGQLQQSIEAKDLEGVAASMAMNCPDMPSATMIRDGVAIIPVRGVLRDEADYMVRYYGSTCYQLLERDLDAALNNDAVKNVVLWFSTPGGLAIGVKRAADKIAASRGEKPIVAFCQSVCGSAGYYLAAACDRIECTADAMLGSIGTIYTHQELSGMAKEMGVGITIFTNEDSPKKGHGNQFEPLTAAAKTTIQGFVDAYGAPFINDVARYRGTTPANVIKQYGQGDAFVGSEAKRRGMVDAIVPDFQSLLDSLAITAASPVPIETATEETESEDSPHVAQSRPAVSPSTILAGSPIRSAVVKKIKAQLFALGLIESMDVADAICQGILAAWFVSRGDTLPTDEAATLKALQSAAPEKKPTAAVANPLQQAHDKEQAEARTEAAAAQKATVADLEASAALLNQASKEETITPAMVLASVAAGHTPAEAVKSWSATLAAKEKPVAKTIATVTSEGEARWQNDVVDAMLYRATAQGTRHRRREGQPSASGVRTPTLTDGAAAFVNRPLWSIAAECLERAGQTVDRYGDRELICRNAMELGNATSRHTFFSAHEGRQFVSAATGIPFARPGDFPNVLSAMANKFIDSIELDEWTYPEFTAVWPTGFGDFKPAVMINMGGPDELDEVLDAGVFNELKKQEEVLSYIFCRRFGNKWGWTPVLLANDDMGAFAEGMLGLDEAWETTQHRLCLALLTGNPTLLDGVALFASHAQGGNDRTSGAVPSDTEWSAMEELYADIKGIAPTTRRVRGALNTILVPTGAANVAALRTFATLNTGGLEGKLADTTANVGIYRGLLKIIPEPELRDDSVATRYYGMRSPTQLRTATIVRGYFNGFGQGGRRERWYDYETKTTWVSIEGRIGVAIKNWRYIVRNKGAA